MGDYFVIMILVNDFWSLVISEESRGECRVDYVLYHDSLLIV